MSEYIKPPLGLIPKTIYKEISEKNRFYEVCRAIIDYYNAGLEIDIEWIKEYNEYVSKKFEKEHNKGDLK